MPIGKLQIEGLPGRHGPRRAYAAPIGVAHQGKAALQGALIAERAQQLGCPVKPSAAPREIGEPDAAEAARKPLETLPGTLQPCPQQGWRQAPEDALEPGALGSGAAQQGR